MEAEASKGLDDTSHDISDHSSDVAGPDSAVTATIYARTWSENVTGGIRETPEEGSMQNDNKGTRSSQEQRSIVEAADETPKRVAPAKMDDSTLPGRHEDLSSSLATMDLEHDTPAGDTDPKPPVAGNSSQGLAGPSGMIHSAEKHNPERGTAGQHEDSKSEIQDIMAQFQHVPPDSIANQDMSPTGSTLPIFQYPPRSSSLEHIQQEPSESQAGQPAASSNRASDPEKNALSRTSTISQPPLPEPEPESDLPFDFQRFLEQLRHRTADPVAKFLRSFLHEFSKKQWMVHEQTKIVGDFLTFISGRMAQCEVWRTVSDAEFDNAREGMEKLVMNRLYAQTFSPEIPPPAPLKGLKKGPLTPQGSGRRGQHQEDIERDEVLAQKIRIYGWVEGEHLDIKPFDEKGRRFLKIAQQELAKIKSYRAPRDKVICVLNSCKVLFGFLRTAKSEQSADAFIPLLIYTVLKADPDHLVSNVQYILRFRNQDKLNGEAGYYMSSLLGAVQFIENLDRTSLTVSDEDFEKNVEKAVSAIAERRSREEKRASAQLPFNEKSTPSRPEVTPRHSMEGEHISPRRKAPRGGTSSGIDHSPGEESDDNAAVSGLLRTIQKPLTTIGRIFSDDGGPQLRNSDDSNTTQKAAPTARLSSAPSMTASQQQVVPPELPPGANAQEARRRIAAEDAAARQASTETTEAHRLKRAEYQTVVETLSGMFPDLDKDVIGDVVRMKQGRQVSTA